MLILHDPSSGNIKLSHLLKHFQTDGEKRFVNFQCES